jgi:hypothetical protein
MLMLASMLASAAHSQTLQNTLWRAYNSNNTPGYIFISGRIISVGFNNSGYTIEHLYTTNGNIFTKKIIRLRLRHELYRSYTCLRQIHYGLSLFLTRSMRQNYFNTHAFFRSIQEQKS